MAESDDLDDLDGGEAPEASSSSRKKGGLGNLLPTILKFAAIGIAAVIFIVTITFITVRIINKSGQPQTSTDVSSPYIGKRPVYSYFTEIGTITTKTRDDINYSVTVTMNIGFDQGDQVAASELSVRRLELRDFVRNYFSGKYANELRPENEARLKQDIKEILNTRFLDTGKVRIILFDKLDVMETF